MIRIFFAIHTNQDFYLSLSYILLIKEFFKNKKIGKKPKFIALVFNDNYNIEYKKNISEFDEYLIIDRVDHSRNILKLYNKILKLRNILKGIKFSKYDYLIVYSYREFFINVLIKNLDEKPTLIAIRKCDHEVEKYCTRIRIGPSFLRNSLEFLFAFSTMRYRWNPSTNRSYNYNYVRNPFDHIFCLNTLKNIKKDGYQIPYPFSVLKNRLNTEVIDKKTPTIIFLGEIYPFYSGMDIKELSLKINNCLNFINDNFKGYSLIFKPRGNIKNVNLNLKRFEVAYSDVSLESLLVSGLNIRKVFSFKSSGSFISAQFGFESYLLYPLLEFPKNYKKALDDYFVDHLSYVNLLESIEDIKRNKKNKNVQNSFDEIYSTSNPLLKLFK